MLISLHGAGQAAQGPLMDVGSSDNRNLFLIVLSETIGLLEAVLQGCNRAHPLSTKEWIPVLLTD